MRFKVTVVESVLDQLSTQTLETAQWIMITRKVKSAGYCVNPVTDCWDG